MAIDLELAKQTATWMRESGVLSVRLRDADGSEIALTISPDDAPLASYDGEETDGRAPPKTCKHPGCAETTPSQTFGGYCRIHGLQAAGVRVAS